MPVVEWRHNRERLLLPIVILPGYNSANPTESLRTVGLVDTGATGTGIRADVVERLDLRPKGQRRVYTDNGMLMAPEYIIRVGYIPGDYNDPFFTPDTQQPYVLEHEVMGFGLEAGFSYSVLVGMDIIGRGDLAIRRDGTATLNLD